MLNISRNRVRDELINSSATKSLADLQSPTVRVSVVWTLRSLLLLLIIVLFLPWQQNIAGKGYVTALNPSSRPQNIQNAVAGQIREWRVGEGDFVKKGDTLFIVSEVKDDYFDPQILTRTKEQIKAKQSGINAYEAKITALGGQISALRQGLDFSLQKTRNKLKQAQMKVRADSADLTAARKNNQITIDRLRRGEEMYGEGLISLTDLESRRLKAQEDNQKQISTEQKLLISRNELINAKIELSSVMVEYQKDIAKAESDRSSGQSSLADGQGELSKLQNKFENIRLRRNQYVICAPQDGYIVKTLKAGIGETIKEGESVITLQPNNPKLAIELYIDAMDLPLVAKNRPVRMEFDGWPALQFSGWPGASVGTFGGQVAVIDRITSKNGQYRILIKQDEKEQIWPEQIRIGSAVQGIIMLEDVPVWWEIWRQLNAFPPNYIDEKTEEKK